MDKNYWNSYYRKTRGPADPTAFARQVIRQFPPGATIFELGCGNGRDTFFFARNGYQVYACDQSEVIIKRLRSQNTNPRFFCHDLTTMYSEFRGPVDIVYARFLLHVLSKDEADQTIQWVHDILVPGGRFYSESRSKHSSLYGQGTHITNDIYMTDHKRRFIDKDELVRQLEEGGFTPLEVVESAGLAVYRDDDPVVIRITARKQI